MDDIRVILVDDHAMVRQGLAQALDEQPGLRVIAQAGDGNEALRLMADPGADVLVVDYTLPDLDGPAVIQRLLAEQPDAHVVVLTMHDNVHYALKAHEAGAQGFCVKSDALDELAAAIRLVHEGGHYVSPRLSDRVAQQLRTTRKTTVGVDRLSQREFELMRHLALGLTLQECAQQMEISESTASTYRARLMSKLELTSTAQIIRFALEHGITG